MKRFPPAMSHARPNAVLLLVGALALLLLNLGGWDLWNPDEPRYAQIAREMIETGDYVHPHLNGESYSDKPPLFFWLVAGTGRIAGDVTPFAARLPAAAAAAGMVLLTWLLAARLMGRSGATCAALILLTSVEFFWIATSCHLDTLLGFWIVLAILLFHAGIEQNRPSLYPAAYAVMGLALLTKGPVGVCIPLIAIVPFAILRCGWGGLARLRFGSGALIMLAILAVWLVPSCLAGGWDYTSDILLRQTFGRVVDSYSHQKPFYYYLINFPAGFMPWTLFLPAAALYFRRTCRDQGAMLLPACWLIGALLFFSLVSCKRSLYLIPVFPAAAILIARFWHSRFQTPLHRDLRGIGLPLALLALVCATAGAGAGVAALAAPTAGLGSFRPVLLTAGAWLLVCGAAGLALVLSGAPARSLFAWVVVLLIGSGAVLNLSIRPAVDRFKSGRAFSTRIAAAVGPQDHLVATFDPERFNYYLHRYPIPIITAPSELDALAGTGRPVYVLAEQEDYETAPIELRRQAGVVDRDTIGHSTYVLLRWRQDVRDAEVL